MNNDDFCGRPGTGECSCAKFGADPKGCSRREEWRAEQSAVRVRKVILVLPYPVSANRYWATRVVAPKGGRAMAMTYVTPEAKKYKADVLAVARAAGITAPIFGRVQLDIRLYPHRPLDWATRQRKFGAAWDDTVQCIDLGNAEKVLSDALKDIVMEDDKWIRKIISERMEPDHLGARVVVRVLALDVEKPQLDLAGVAP